MRVSTVDARLLVNLFVVLIGRAYTGVEEKRKWRGDLTSSRKEAKPAHASLRAGINLDVNVGSGNDRGRWGERSEHRERCDSQ